MRSQTLGGDRPYRIRRELWATIDPGRERRSPLSQQRAFAQHRRIPTAQTLIHQNNPKPLARGLLKAGQDFAKLDPWLSFAAPLLVTSN